MDPDRSQTYHPEKDVHHITLYSTVAREHQHISLKKRLYLHLDMNCFYAQVEQHAHNLYGFPVAMGGWRKPDGTPRGIVATASYEARKLGVKTAMSAYEAWKICPWLIFLQIDYERYQEISRQLHTILDTFSPDVEKYSMDEYFLDITFLLGKSRADLEHFGTKLKEAVYQRLGLVCSVGIALSKTYSKLASDIKKPNGLCVLLTAYDVANHFFALPLDEVWGIGSRRYQKLQKHGLNTIADAFRHGSGPFKKIFGPMQGQLFYEIVTGRDRARVLDHSDHTPEEVSYMHTFSDWSVDTDQIRGEIVKAVRNVCYRLRGYRRKARKWVCTIRYQDAKWKGASIVFTTDGYTSLDDYVLEACIPRAIQQVQHALRQGYRIRGVGLHTIDMDASGQSDLFFQENRTLRKLYRATDLINNTYGNGTVAKAATRNGVPGKTHFTERS
ncbi:MAG: DNA polymerase IV [Balneolaceae bacterium]